MVPVSLLHRVLPAAFVVAICVGLTLLRRMFLAPPSLPPSFGADASAPRGSRPRLSFAARPVEPLCEGAAAAAAVDLDFWQSQLSRSTPEPPRHTLPRPICIVFAFLGLAALCVASYAAYRRPTGDAELTLLGAAAAVLIWSRRASIQHQALRNGMPIAGIITQASQSFHWWKSSFAAYAFTDPFGTVRRGSGHDFTEGLAAGSPVLVYCDPANPSHHAIQECAYFTLDTRPRVSERGDRNMGVPER